MSSLVSNSEPAPGTEIKIDSGLLITFTLKPRPQETLPQLLARLDHRLREQEAMPLHMLVFGKTTASGAAAEAIRKIFGRTEWPLTWVEGAACDGGPVAGIQVHAFTGDVERIESGGRMVGSVFTDGGGRLPFLDYFRRYYIDTNLFRCHKMLVVTYALK